MPQMTLSERRTVFGTTEPPEPLRWHRVGDLSFQMRRGQIGTVLFGGVEVLRGILYLVRDEAWGTSPSRLGRIQKRKVATPDGPGLLLSFEGHTSQGGAVLGWEAKVLATAKELRFSVTACPDADMRTNRTGFVVLHPIHGVAGQPLTVTHTDGRSVSARFPEFISPGQPFFGIRGLTHSPVPGLTAHVTLEGDTFEMEDQRNWGDASFKTYGRSLLDPWPYVLPRGKPFTKTITLRLEGKPRVPARAQAPSGLSVPRPLIGLSIATAEAAATLRRCALLAELRPDFLTCFVDADTPPSVLATYARLARETDLPITLELVVAGKRAAMDEVEETSAALKAARLAPQAVVITEAQDLKSWQPGDMRPAGPGFIELARALRRHFPDAEAGGGMLSFFTELNRKRPPLGLFDFVTHSLCPIVHDASDAAVMQVLETLPDIFASAREIIGPDAAYDLGPTTIAARMNPYGDDVVPNPDKRRVCLAARDPRQFATFAVDWNRGLIAAAGRAGLRRVTLGGLCGPRGLLDRQGHPVPLFTALKEILANPCLRDLPPRTLLPQGMEREE